jgi:hypothetical protein
VEVLEPPDGKCSIQFDSAALYGLAGRKNKKKQSNRGNTAGRKIKKKRQKVGDRDLAQLDTTLDGAAWQFEQISEDSDPEEGPSYTDEELLRDGLGRSPGKLARVAVAREQRKQEKQEVAQKKNERRQKAAARRKKKVAPSLNGLLAEKEASDRRRSARISAIEKEIPRVSGRHQGARSWSGQED